jgi:hypothetical protein
VISLKVSKEDEVAVCTFLTKLCLLLRPDFFPESTYPAWETLFQGEQEVTLKEFEAVIMSLKRQEFDEEFDHWN